jgi:predicted amidohydrolase YtcJ
MRKSLLALAATLFASAAYPETLINNVNGIQVGPDGKLQHFTGLLIGDDGRVEEVLNGPPPAVRYPHIIDGGGQTLLPGLIDAHGHVMGLGFSALQLDLVGTSSLADLQQRLKAYAAAHPDARWIIGRGWNQELWPDKSFPTAADLDAVVSDLPVALERVDGHAVVVNKAALKAAGITTATKDPVGGKIEHDSSGNPTGLLVDAATELVRKHVPSPDLGQRYEALIEAQDLLLSNGVTAVADMGTSAEDWGAMWSLNYDQALHVRILSYAFGNDAATSIRSKYTERGIRYDHLQLVGVKFYADGALGSRGAWLKQPYSDQPDARGLQFHADAEMLRIAAAAASRRLQVATHAIGDSANAQLISVYEQLSKKYGSNRRWRIEHFQIADPADIARRAPAGIIASRQPTHQTSDRLMAEKRLGPDRLAGAYAWQSVLKSGAKLAFGSDFPVESPNPFPGLAAAISRQDINGQPPGGWIPSERLTFEQALAAFTRGAAYAGFAEDKIGALEPGKWADFIIVDRDPSKVDRQQLARTQVLETWVAGKKVWDRAPTASATERGK